ncbi:hypothetical protein GF336_02150 [Candidatus Woesearchaeota archaeon]|nr:hypothetical protein [Candidatus Woesearchaeota archaeon]
MNFIIIKASTTFTSQLQIESSSQMNLHAFFRYCFAFFFSILYESNINGRAYINVMAKADHGQNYFEGILQLRNPTERLKRFVKSEVKKRGEWIAKIVKQKNGVDYYISSQRFLRALGKKLKSHFDGELITSRKLFTQDKQTMKRVYRVNVLFRMHDYKAGQIVKYKGKDVMIKKVGNKIQGTFVDDGKKVMIEFKELR